MVDASEHLNIYMMGLGRQDATSRYATRGMALSFTASPPSDSQ